ncbi:MAG: hypothetical protein ACLU3F_13780 [Blautia wexlerae]
MNPHFLYNILGTIRTLVGILGNWISQTRC